MRHCMACQPWTIGPNRLALWPGRVVQVTAGWQLLEFAPKHAVPDNVVGLQRTWSIMPVCAMFMLLDQLAGA